MLKPGLLLFIVLLLLNTMGLSQSYSFKNYGEEEGLCGNSVYDMYQDSYGYMWFVSNHGISRFDGQYFKNYTSLNGLPDNAVIKMFEDRYGVLWFSTYNGNLSYLQGDTILPHPQNAQIKEFGRNYLIENFFVDPLDNHWIFTNYGKVGKIDPKIGILKEVSPPVASEEQNLYFRYSEGEVICGIIKAPTVGNLPTSLCHNDGYCNLKFSKSIPSRGRRKFFCPISSNDMVLSYTNKLLRIKEGELVCEKDFDSDVVSINKDSNGDLWIGLLSGGVFRYLKGDLNTKPQQFMGDMVVTKVIQDTEGNYWFSTEGDGLYFISGFDFKTYLVGVGKKGNDIISLKICQGNLFFTTKDNQLFRGRVDKEHLSDVKKLHLKGEVNNALKVLSVSPNQLWVAGSKYWKYDWQGNPKKLRILGKTTYNHSSQEKTFDSLFTPKVITLLKGRGENTFLGIRYGYWTFQGDQMVDFSKRKGFTHSVKSMLIDQYKKLWIGTQRGLYSRNEDRYNFFGDSINMLNDQITDLKLVGSNLFVATNGHGIMVYDAKDNDLKPLSNNICAPIVKSIYPQGDSLVWIITHNGLNRMRIISHTPFRYQLDHFSKKDGLPSNKINALAKAGDIIWLATPKGITCFNEKKLLKRNSPPSLFISHIGVNGRDTIVTDSLHLKSHERSILFGFDGIDFQDAKEIVFRYQLKGVDDKPILTRDKFAGYPNLDAGKYTFCVNVGDEEGNWRKDPICIDVQIDQPLTQSVYFLFIVGVLALSILLLIIFQVIKIQKKRVEVKREFFISQQKALSSQMNPHFMFNALNSIQSFIVGKDDELTDIYLSDFSSLLRMILENSKEFKISLQRVLDTMNLYVELEKLRFEDNFEFSLELDPKLRLDEMKIPPMMIQPFLENAIWHGIMPSPNKGVVCMGFHLIGPDRILCEVQDNGIGRGKAMQIKKRRGNSTSLGIANVERRIALFNHISKEKIKLNIIDLFDQQGNATGTRIELEIPVGI